LTEPTWQHGAGRHLIKPKRKSKTPPDRSTAALGSSPRARENPEE
jgi:hypothetical protein